jgi:uncharacterized damage-inducible protein DinB
VLYLATDNWSHRESSQVANSEESDHDHRCSFAYDPVQGKNYALMRQWIIWHVIAHDLHHGGELAFTLGKQGISLPELGEEGGHLSERAPLAEPS